MLIRFVRLLYVYASSAGPTAAEKLGAPPRLTEEACQLQAASAVVVGCIADLKAAAAPNAPSNTVANAVSSVVKCLSDRVAADLLKDRLNNRVNAIKSAFTPAFRTLVHSATDSTASSSSTDPRPQDTIECARAMVRFLLGVDECSGGSYSNSTLYYVTSGIALGACIGYAARDIINTRNSEERVEREEAAGSCDAVSYKSGMVLLMFGASMILVGLNARSAS